MARDFQPVEWDAQLEDDCRQLVRLAIREDLDRGHDWTSAILIGPEVQGTAAVVAREPGVVAGLVACAALVDEYDPLIVWQPETDDGDRVVAGQVLGQMSGPARSLLAAERPLLNLLGRLAGIATLTSQFVSAIAGSNARIYDTRKTLLGSRRLDKYAVRMGGGCNHRMGLFDAVLIKDNHLALGAQQAGRDRYTPGEAVRRIREFQSNSDHPAMAGLIVEVEVDGIEQLQEVLPAGPDIVLLDNMSPEELRQAVAMRDERAPEVELEASGGVRLETVAAIAASGVDRISAGQLTHSARWLDVGLDWR